MVTEREEERTKRQEDASIVLYHLRRKVYYSEKKSDSWLTVCMAGGQGACKHDEHGLSLVKQNWSLPRKKDMEPFSIE